MFTPASVGLSVESVRVRLHEFLAECERRCEPGDVLPARELRGQGYHTTVPNGTWVRPTRDAADYALALLAEGGTRSVARALAIIERLLPAQDAHPCNRTFGLWPWFFEEPLDAMRPPDWNWADFIGVRLAHVLGRHGDQLTGELRSRVRQALHRAAYSIFRRNMGPDYTNIAVKGGVVAVMAGEQLADPLLLAYGRERLSRFLAHTAKQGGFTEYNSPPYGALVLVEVERGLLLIKDESARASLMAIHETCWRAMAASLHLPTGQLCGPHARAYDDTLSVTHATLLEAELGVRLFQPTGQAAPHEGGRDFINLLLIPRVPCPPAVRQQILDAPEDRGVRQTYVAHSDPEVRRIGTMWFKGEACMGSINVENLWQQRRPVIGYWRIGDTVALLRVRLTHGGKDFASGVLRCEQRDAELVACCSLVTNKADSHDHMDMPPDGVFRFDQVALCVELTAPDAQASGSAGAGFVLSGGGRDVVVRPMHAEFGPYDVAWELVRDGNKVSARALINGGAAVELLPSAMRNVAIAFYLSLNAQAAAAKPAQLNVETEADALTLTVAEKAGHDPLVLRCPRHPLPLR